MTQAAVWAPHPTLIGQKLGSCSAPWSQYSVLSHISEAISDVFLKTVQDALNLISFSWEMSESDISLLWWYAYRFDGFFRGMHGNLSTLYTCKYHLYIHAMQYFQNNFFSNNTSSRVGILISHP